MMDPKRTPLPPRRYCGSFTSNLIVASCSGALPSLRRNGSQRGSAWILSNRLDHDFGEAGVAVLDRLVEPLECLVGLAAEG